MLVASITERVTDFIGNHGIYAVFGLMLIDAVFPAASEIGRASCRERVLPTV